MTKECLSYQKYKDELKPFIMKRLKSDIREKRIDGLLKESYEYIVDYCISLCEEYKDNDYKYNEYLQRFEEYAEYKRDDVGYYLHIVRNGWGLYENYYHNELKNDLYNNTLIYLGVNEKILTIDDFPETLSDDISDLEDDISESVENFYSVKVENLQIMKESINEVNN
ncbi:hypothetical protein O0A22_11540 [Staphylococcus pseudintermedius]|nr:hypothetical protein [Staphylococcus pseudintermedius]